MDETRIQQLLLRSQAPETGCALDQKIERTLHKHDTPAMAAGLWPLWLAAAAAMVFVLWPIVFQPNDGTPGNPAANSVKSTDPRAAAQEEEEVAPLPRPSEDLIEQWAQTLETLAPGLLASWATVTPIACEIDPDASIEWVNFQELRRNYPDFQIFLVPCIYMYPAQEGDIGPGGAMPKARPVFHHTAFLFDTKNEKAHYLNHLLYEDRTQPQDKDALVAAAEILGLKGDGAETCLKNAELLFKLKGLTKGAGTAPNVERKTLQESLEKIQTYLDRALSLRSLLHADRCSVCRIYPQSIADPDWRVCYGVEYLQFDKNSGVLLKTGALDTLYDTEDDAFEAFTAEINKQDQ